MSDLQWYLTTNKWDIFGFHNLELNWEFSTTNTTIASSLLWIEDSSTLEMNDYYYSSLWNCSLKYRYFLKGFPKISWMVAFISPSCTRRNLNKYIIIIIIWEEWFYGYPRRRMVLSVYPRRRMVLCIYFRRRMVLYIYFRRGTVLWVP